MDRIELRFCILFEYYKRFHDPGYDANSKVREIDADSNEKRAAKVWLVDEGYVKGHVQSQVGCTMASIGRINSDGVNFVESVMDGAFTEIRGQDGGFDSLSKAGKIKRFAAECLGGPAAGPMCRAAYEAIAAFMR